MSSLIAGNCYWRRNCYVHLLLTGSEPLTYSNNIFTEFDNRRITYCGKICQSKDALYNYYIVVLIFLLDMERTKDYKNAPIITL